MLLKFRASDNTQLNYLDHGQGRLIIFQHGFGMDHQQVVDTWPNFRNIRLVCLDTRGHGLSELGPESTLSFTRAVTDLLELIDHLDESPVAVGGTSLGAALVMQLSKQIATSHLVLSRPAFGIDGDTHNFEVFRVLERIIQERSSSEWLQTLEQTKEFRVLAMSAPRNQETYRRLLNHPRLGDLMDWMRALDQEALSVEASDITQYQGRVDVIGQSHDALHPLQLALDLASLYPNAKVHEIAPGFASDDENQESVRHTLYEILKCYDYL